MTIPLILVEKIVKLVERLIRERFYGVIEIHFENGRIFRLKKMHSIEGEELERLIST